MPYINIYWSGFAVFFVIGLLVTSRFGFYWLPPGERGWIYAGLTALAWPFTLVLYAALLLVLLWILLWGKLQGDSDTDSSDSN